MSDAAFTTLYPTTPAQQGFLLGTLTSPEDAVFVEQTVFPLTGPLDLVRLQAAATQMVADHEILRTALVWDLSSDPRQVVLSDAELPIEEWDSSGKPETEQLAGPFLAALALLLHHQSAATDIRIGMMISNRARPDTEHLIGYFVNTAVIRLRLHPELTAAALTEAANEAVRQALEHQALPIQDLKRELQSKGPLYQVTLALNTMRPHTLALNGVDCQDLDMEETGPRLAPTTIEQRWVIEERDGALSGTLTYQTGTFTAPQIRMALGHLDQAIAAVTAGHPTVAAVTDAFRRPAVRT